MYGWKIIWQGDGWCKVFQIILEEGKNVRRKRKKWGKEEDKGRGSLIRRERSSQNAYFFPLRSSSHSFQNFTELSLTVLTSFFFFNIDIFWTFQELPVFQKKLSLNSLDYKSKAEDLESLFFSFLYLVTWTTAVTLR